MYRLYLRIRLWILTKIYLLQLFGWIPMGDTTGKVREIYRIRDILKEGMTVIYEAKYQSMSEILQACDKAWKDGRHCTTLSGLTDASFVGRAFDGWEDCKKACLQPWQEGLDIVQEMIHLIEKEGHSLPPPVDRRRKPRFHPDTGDEVELDRLRGGQDYWRSVERQSVRGPQYVSLITNIASAGSRRPEEILWRGATAIVLCDLMEKAGYRVEIHLVDQILNCWPGNEGMSLITLLLKEASQPLDISTVTTAISGWFYRTVFFQIYHVPPWQVSSGYGRPLDLEADNPLAQELAGAGAKPVTIDRVFYQQAALEKIRTVIQQLNEGTL